MANLKNIINSFKIKNELDTKIWDKKDDKYVLKKNIREKLLQTAYEFYESLGVDIVISDITFTGSLANFNWSEFSDIDLHLISDFNQFNKDVLPLYKELFMLKKTIFNEKHDITILNYEVELYVQDENEEHTSTGVYSVLNDEWIVQPKKDSKVIDKKFITNKSKQWMEIIDGVLENISDESLEDAKSILKKYKDKLKKYRTCGLEKGGEYSTENLVFKVLRRNGYIEKLYNASNKLVDNKLSLKERRYIVESLEDDVNLLITELENIKEEIFQPNESELVYDKNVETVQKALDLLSKNGVGTYTFTKIDGKYGTETADAVEQFKVDFDVQDEDLTENIDNKIKQELKKLLKEKSNSDDDEEEGQLLGSPLKHKLAYSNDNSFKSKKRPNHLGVDYHARSGSEAIAVADGTVTAARYMSKKERGGNCGGIIAISHANNFQSSYCHMKEFGVQPGDKVKKGDVVGLTGGGAKDKGRGNSSGDHLHYQLKKNGVPVDPNKYLNIVRVNSASLGIDSSEISGEKEEYVDSFISLKMIEKLIEELKKLLLKDTTVEVKKDSVQDISDEDFYKKILTGIGAPLSQNNLKFLYAWTDSVESAASYNPLSMTYNYDKDTDSCYYNCILSDETITTPIECKKCPEGSKPNVMNYSSKLLGIEATVEGLLKPKFGCVVDGLKNQSPASVISSCTVMIDLGLSFYLLTVFKNYGENIEPPKIRS